MNRKRLKGEGGKEDCREALDTLFNVLMIMIQIMAPFTPFLTELMYQNLKNILMNRNEKENVESVHYLMLPEVQEYMIDENVERQVSRLQTVVEVGRIVRDRRTLPIKYPLSEAIIISKDQSVLDDIKSLERYVLEELNIKNLTLTTEKEKYGVKLRAEPDIKALGMRLRNESKAVIQAIRDMTDAQLQEYQNSQGDLTVAGHKLEPDDIRIKYAFGGDLSEKLAEKYEADSDSGILVLLDITRDASLEVEGTAREIINRIQKLRKKGQLVPSDPVTVFYGVPAGGVLEKVVQEFNNLIVSTLKAPIATLPIAKGLKTVISETQELKGEKLEIVIGIKEGHNLPASNSSDTQKKAKSPPKKAKSDHRELNGTLDSNQPYCKFVNVELHQSNGEVKRATLLLENPIGEFMSAEDLLRNVSLGNVLI